MVGRNIALGTAVLASVLIGVAPARAQPEDGAQVPVPDVRRLTPRAAADALADAGLRLERIHEVAVPSTWQTGLVFQQLPAPDTDARPSRLSRGGGVQVRVSARQDGPPGGVPPPDDWPQPVLPEPAPPEPVPPAPVVPEAAPPAPVPEPDATPAPAPAPVPATTPDGRLRAYPGPTPPPPPPDPAVDVRLPAAPPTGPLVPVGPMPGPVAPADVAPAPAPVPAPVAPEPEPLDPVPVEPLPAAPVPVAPAPRNPAPVDPDPAPATGPPVVAPPVVEPPPSAPTATGTPDAPAVAPPADPSIVPDLLGLALVDAEHRALEAEMQLHVERVPGHPVGRVLEQSPPGGSPRPAAGVVRVVVTAGGDQPAAVPPAPGVAVNRIAVPDLLDRTGPQVERILGDLGLLADLRDAERGPPGRVGDQRPGPGTVVEKGTRVVVWLGPPLSRPLPTPPPSAPASSPPAPEAPAPAPSPAGPAGMAPPAPVPVAPPAGTVVGGDRTLALGFTWRPAPGADAYVVEVEERGPDGWIPNARRTTRTAAAVLEIERTCPTPGALRWRVTAGSQGRHGPPSAWVELR